MREFKFRFYLRDMVYSNEYVDLADFFAEYVEECANTGKKISLMQYTGIKDINGKEIYEGDICRYFNGRGIEIGVVKYIREITTFKLIFDDGAYGDLFNVEVAGNIFETTSLEGKI